MPRTRLAGAARLMPPLVAAVSFGFVFVVWARLGTWSPLILLEAALCTAAAASVRWPRTGAALTLALLGVTALVNTGEVTMASIVALVPLYSLSPRTRVFRVAYSAVWLAIVIPWIGWDGRIGWFDVVLISCMLLFIAFGISEATAQVLAGRDRAHARRLERQRLTIARELHDLVARDLTRVSLLAEQAKAVGGMTPEQAETLSRVAQQGVLNLRRVMAHLRDTTDPPLGSWDEATLASSIEKAVDALRRDGFDVTADVWVDLSLDEGIDAALARLVDEAAANILRHARRGSTCTIRAEAGPSRLVVEMTNLVDDATDRPHEGMGVTGMHERMEMVGGTAFVGRDGDLWIVRAEVAL